MVPLDLDFGWDGSVKLVERGTSRLPSYIQVQCRKSSLHDGGARLDACRAWGSKGGHAAGR